MSAETKKVLEMLAEGKISSEDAERILEKLTAEDRFRSGERNEEEPATARTARPKYLRVLVDGTEGKKVNIRVPLALVSTGLKLTTMMPKEATDSLNEKGIDLSKLGSLKGEDLIEALRELTVDVQSDGGETVRIFCE